MASGGDLGAENSILELEGGDRRLREVFRCRMSARSSSSDVDISGLPSLRPPKSESAALNVIALGAGLKLLRNGMKMDSPIRSYIRFTAGSSASG